MDANMTPDNLEAAHSSSAVGGTAILLLVSILLATIHLLRQRMKNIEIEQRNKGKTFPPGPKPLPLLGSLHHLGQTVIPFEGFTRLQKIYGDIFSIRLGSTDCVVVNTPELMEEVMVTKANDFDGRPDFERFRILFGGAKDNSLAFCDFSALHKKRRALISHYSLPYSHSSSWERMNKICMEECWNLTSYVAQIMSSSGSNRVTLDIKSILLKACGNIFNRYFCDSSHFDYDDPAFNKYVSAFENVFWEVNNGRLCDFIPALTFTAAVPIMQSKRSAKQVREFVKDFVVAPRIQQCASDQEQVLLDHLMSSITGEKTKKVGVDFSDEMDNDMAMYALEDILGGHTAIACVALRAIWDVVQNPEAAEKIRKEIESVEASDDDSRGTIYSMSNCENMHWARAAMFESIRKTCSPIVPHRATSDTSVGGFDIKANTVLFVNNHELNMSEKYWGQDAENFRASRFLIPREGGTSDDDLIFRRPVHFAPFSYGKRSCMGFKLIETITLVLMIAMLKNYDLSITEETSKLRIEKGMLALPLKPMEMVFSRRTR